MSATKLDLRNLPLAKGAHNRDQGEACVMELASYIAGERWSDSPACVSLVIGAFLRGWNDALPDDQRQQLKRYLACRSCGEVHNGNDADHPADVPLLNTKGTKDQEAERAWMATDWLVRVQAPAWLRCAGLDRQAASLASLPELRSAMDVPPIKPTLEAVRADASAAGAAAGAAARAAAGAAARDAAWAAARAAARDAARAAAGDAAWDAARDAAGDAARDAARDAAWDAAGAAAGDAARDAAWAAARDAAGDAAGAAARAAARDAARDALQPTVDELQPLAHDLIARMIAVTA